MLKFIGSTYQTMNELIDYIESRTAIQPLEIELVKKHFVIENVSANQILSEAGKVERYIYFIIDGIVKGYQNIDGKIIIQHLVNEQDFFTSLDSFMNETPSLDYYETITDCKLLKLSKVDYDFLQNETTFWETFVKNVTSEHLNCKLNRVRDFQTLTAKERYVKFVDDNPKLALNVSIDNIASFLGMEPQSLSRIRKQLTI